MANEFRHRLMFVFETKNLIIETNDLGDLSGASWFRELIELRSFRGRMII
jgi:hypothetical protein